MRRFTLFILAIFIASITSIGQVLDVDQQGINQNLSSTSEKGEIIQNDLGITHSSLGLIRAPVTTLTHCPNDATAGNPDFGAPIPDLTIISYYPASVMGTYTGNVINKIAVGVHKSDFTGDLIIKIWTDTSGFAATTAYEQTVAYADVVDGWNEIVLATPYAIDGNTLSFGYTINSTDGHGAAYDNSAYAADSLGSSLVSANYSYTGKISGSGGYLSFSVKAFVDDGVTDFIDAEITALTGIPNWNCDLPASNSITAEITNSGTLPTGDFTLSCKINDVVTGSAISVSSIAVGATGTAIFDLDFSTDDTMYDLEFYINEIAGDVNLNNDTASSRTHNTAVNTVPMDVVFDLSTGYDGYDFKGWNYDDVNSDDAIWYFRNNSANAHSGDGYMSYSYHATNPADDYMYSNCIDLVAGNYTLKFWAKTLTDAGGPYPEKLRVDIGMGQNAAAMTQIVTDLGEIDYTDWEETVVTFDITTAGTYNLGFYAYSDANMWQLLVDDISLGLTPVAPTVSADACTGTITVDAGTDAQTFYLYNGDGTVEIANSGNVNATSYDFSSVADGTYTAAYEKDGFISLLSTQVTLTNSDATVITSQPMNIAICDGEDATFTVVATGTNLSYQWQKDNVDIVGATSDTYTISPATATDAGDYTCNVSGDCGDITSSVASLSLNALTVITTQPSSDNLCEGSDITFTVEATGDNLTYQWKKAGVDIASATNNTFTISDITLADAADYTCNVSGCDAVLSDAATLTIDAALILTPSVTNASGCGATDGIASVVATGGDNVNYAYSWNTTPEQYTATTTNTLGASVYTVEVISGACIETAEANVGEDGGITVSVDLTDVTICLGDPATTVTASSTGSNTAYAWTPTDGLNVSDVAVVEASPIVNTVYTVTGTDGACTSQATVSFAVNNSVNITTQPIDVAVCSGDDVSYSVVAEGTGLTYQWKDANGDDIAGEIAPTLTLNDVTMAGEYSCVITGDCGSQTTNVALLTINTATAITTQPMGTTVCEGENVTFSVVAEGTSLTYQWQVDNIDITGATSDTYSINTVTTANAGNYICIVTGVCGTTVINSNPAMLTVNPAEVITITTQPANQTVCDGEVVTFEVIATGAGLTYQWQFNGGIIGGATLATYIINPATAANAGSYACIISASCNTQTSSTANLSFNTTTAITTQPIPTQSLAVGDQAIFTVVAEGTGLIYQWKKGGVNIAGATNATYTINPIDEDDVASYTCEVTGACGTVTSDASALSIDYTTINPVIDSKDVKVYPNPNNGQFNIDLNLSVNSVNMEVVNMQGQFVIKLANIDANSIQTIDLGNVAQGMYYIRISSDNKTIIKKINVVR